uniref:Uncharacterized protein n=1 Tax=Arundo donax TaxID=35708 RepID=A0A0A9FMA4_ARUDO
MLSSNPCRPFTVVIANNLLCPLLHIVPRTSPSQ